MALSEIKNLVDLYIEIKKYNSVDEKLVNAHHNLNNAFIQTYDYLKNNNGKYIPNKELAEVWNLASTSIILIDKNLGELLYHKSRFWLDPDLYFRLNRSSQIINLNRIIDEMEKIRLKIK